MYHSLSSVHKSFRTSENIAYNKTMGKSIMEQLALLPEDEKARILSGMDADALLWDWSVWGRPEQQTPEGNWNIWLYMAGRGAGKTRTAAEWVREQARYTNTGQRRFALVARTAADVRDVIVEGEALALSTLIATPTGFVSMKDVREGDAVLGGDGSPCRVTKVFPVLYERPCFEMDISGVKVIADANHKWLTSTHVERSYEQRLGRVYEGVRTTEELYYDQKTPSGYSISNHAIRISPTLGERAELPIPPYALGVWLGDGTSKCADVTCHTDDQPHVRGRIESEGFPTSSRKDDYCFGVRGGFTGLLKENNLIRNKHIPEAYFHSSFDQRMALLQGLIDTDGTVSARGQVEFDNTNKILIDGVARLVASLGIKHGGVKLHKEAGVEFVAPNGKKYVASAQYRFTFTTSLPVASLPRKAFRCKKWRSEEKWRYVKSVCPTESVPVRCITVDSDDHTFLITEQYVRTHNSGVMNVSPPSERPHYEPSKRRLTWPNGNVATCFTADEPDSLRGPQFRLDISTPIPTPNGWSTMGELKVGDRVFDESGNPCNVTAVHEIDLAVDSYRLTFSNGTYIDADGKHRWKVLSQNDLRYVTTHFDGVIPSTWAIKPFGRESQNHKVKDTNQLLANVGRRLYIPSTKPIQYEEQVSSLPIDPWVLGIVLGDGASRSPSYIATHSGDKEWLLSELEKAGIFGEDRNKDHIWAPGLISSWRSLGLFNNKHIPEVYLTASAKDRLALLQGLTDSDGGVEPSGAFRFYNTNKKLIDGYAELARSLGLVPKIYKKSIRSRRGLKNDKQSWYVQISSTIPLARNPRKLCRAKYKWSYQATEHSIVSIEPISPVLMRCITVDSPSHLYLAGEGMIPTSNTHAWGDEIAAWRQTPDGAGMTAFDNLRVGTRLGSNPQIMCTTTPKRVPLLYKLIEEGEKTGRVVITRGSTLDNAGNLSGAYLEAITGVYQGTRLAQQEIYGEMLDAVEGALWTDELIERGRQSAMPPHTPLRVIGVDPSVAENPRDECGIVVVASTSERDLYKRHSWVLEDASVLGSPDVWANRVVAMARKWGCPVVAEVNQGGALVRNAINSIDPNIKVLEVHSKYGKALRAEPVTLAYEQNRVHHLGYLPDLESQMLSWIPGEGKSPDRVDALVHALTALLIKPPPGLVGGKITARSVASRRLPDFRGGSSLFRLR